jgi:hypothetical protein
MGQMEECRRDPEAAPWCGAGGDLEWPEKRSLKTAYKLFFRWGQGGRQYGVQAIFWISR